ncbi:hypothetical protein LCGC14_2367070 [marine sediment metagenome]|uniref:Uncharacterized protein n=1 Tax=marine sediment metagenome TaxID=412755 RepID=A0A0F9EZQ0_9ZZZZ
MIDFVFFAIIYISKAKGTSRNPIMIEIVRAFISSRHRVNKPSENFVNAYGISMRKSLESRGYISVAAINVSDRRIRYITPTTSFPSKGHTRQLDNVIDLIISDMRELQRPKDKRV